MIFNIKKGLPYLFYADKNLWITKNCFFVGSKRLKQF